MALRLRFMLLFLLHFLYLVALAQSNNNTETTSTLTSLASTTTSPTVLTTTFSIESFHPNSASDFYIATIQPSNGQGAASTIEVWSPIVTGDISISEAYNINVTEIYIPCWFTISGAYGLLPRILFYVTLVFALVARHVDWLIAGALASALTFSGGAAIHACLLAWRGPAAGETDVYALAGILSTSCLIAVPLINWSSTLRHLGQPKVDPSDPNSKRKEGNTRTIIIYWGFLVAVGFLCSFVLVKAPPILPFYDSILDLSNLTTLQCSPPNNYLNTSAGQQPGWTDFWITTEFINENNCVEPCGIPQPSFLGGSLFRHSTDLVTLSRQEVNDNLEQTDLSHKRVAAEKFLSFYVKFALYALPYIIAQGVTAAVFGRKSPSTIRFRVYSFIVSIGQRRRQGEAGAFQRALATIIALMNYLWALLMLIACPPTLVLNIIATEIALHTVPQDEYLTSIGQWQPWAGTALILIAAVIAKTEKDLKDRFVKALENIASKPGRLRRAYEKTEDAEGQGAARPTFWRKQSQAPNPHLKSSFFKDVKAVIKFTIAEIAWYFLNAWDIVAHEMKSFWTFTQNPSVAPVKRQKRPEPKLELPSKQHLKKQGAYHPINKPSIEGASIENDESSTYTTDPNGVPIHHKSVRKFIKQEAVSFGEYMVGSGTQNHQNRGTGTTHSQYPQARAPHAPTFGSENSTLLQSPATTTNSKFHPEANSALPSPKQPGSTTAHTPTSAAPNAPGINRKPLRSFTAPLAGNMASSFDSPDSRRQRRSQAYAQDELSPGAVSPGTQTSPASTNVASSSPVASAAEGSVGGGRSAVRNMQIHSPLGFDFGSGERFEIRKGERGEWWVVPISEGGSQGGGGTAELDGSGSASGNGSGIGGARPMGRRKTSTSQALSQGPGEWRDQSWN